jgi:hypothetical protein
VTFSHTRRRSILLAATLALALGAPAAAGASWYSYDPDTGNADPAGQGTAPEETANNHPSNWQVVYTGDLDATIPSATCTWNVSGRLIVRNPTLDGVQDGDPVAGVEVKVSGKAPGIFAWYSEWDTVTTDADGAFSLSHVECHDRQVKVQARFDSDSLRTTGATSPDWYQLHETSMRGPSKIMMADEPFGGESGQQSITQARTDAQTWIFYRKAIDYFATIGRSFANKVTVHNPATLTSGVSAADPILKEIHIDPNDTSDLDAMAHELGHIWTYPNVDGEGCLTFNAALSGDTHDAQEIPCVAFLEGAAEFISNKLEEEMNAAGLIQSSGWTTTPRNRARLSQTFGLGNLVQVEQSDLGWENIFRTLASSDITRQLYGAANGVPGLVSTHYGPPCTGQPVGQDDLNDALRAIGDSVNRLDVGALGFGATSFLERAADRLASFDDDDADVYLAANTPTVATEPWIMYDLGHGGSC